MLKKVILAAMCLGLIASCGDSNRSTKVKTMQRKDKRLSCKEILLEMNESDFYREMAYKNKGPRLKNMLMPLGYISTYMDAEEAIEAADARVSYLDKIYEIMRCDEQEELQEQTPLYRGSPQSNLQKSAPRAYLVR